jgi:DNA repair protein RecO (recombination protein O)
MIEALALVHERALILQVFAYGDTSKILKLLCENHGVRTVIAKGARRPRGRFGGLLEPFTEGDVQFSLKEGREMHTLSGFDLTRGRQSLGRNLVAFAGASLLAELALRFGTDEPQTELFGLVSRELDRLGSVAADAAPGVAFAGVWQVISLLGYEPRLDACVGCGREISPGEATRFDIEAGGVAGVECRPEGRLIDAQTRMEVAAMCAGDAPQSEATDWRLHRSLLRAFVSSHLTQEHPLRSLDLFLDLLP